jgi:hypothetical protein
MAALTLDALQDFRPATDAEAAPRAVALEHATALYWAARQLADEVAWLNDVAADGEGQAQP